MKVERFLKEYANAKKRAYRFNELMNPGIRAELTRRCDEALSLREKGWITADEALRYIMGNPGEDLRQYMTA